MPGGVGGAAPRGVPLSRSTGFMRHTFEGVSSRNAVNSGFIIDVLFLELNGERFTASEEDAASAVVALADGSLDQEGYTAFLEENLA
jgi:prophage maintenance system killer protein